MCRSEKVFRADRTLSNPCSEEEETYNLRQRERGLTRVECPECGGGAWQEPPCTVNGEVRTVIRCRVCDAARKANLRCVACGERPPRYQRDLCAPCWRRRKETKEMATATNGKAHAVCPYCKKGFNPIRSTQVSCGEEKCKKAHQAFLHKHPVSTRPAVDPAAVMDRAKADLEAWDGKSASEVAKAPPEVKAALLKRGAQSALADGTYDTPASDGIYGDEPGTFRCCPPGQERCSMCAPTPKEAAFAAIPTLHQEHNPRIYEQRDSRNPHACPILAAVLALEAVPDEKRAGVLDIVEARREVALAQARAEGLLQALAVGL